MGFWKFPPFLILSILVLYQAGMLHSAPFRSALESGFVPATLTEEESRLLLAATVKCYVQMKATSALNLSLTGLLIFSIPQISITAQKRSCNTATGVTHKMAGWLSRSGSVIKRNFMPTNVGSKAFGRHHRDLQA
ncbi:hypothetical protein J1605_014281 [Eschrichtius robustus]|uniref:Calcitonin peptide-like domain-containing protein n=1 Tax=Eschrichtius robustus TaxID=9764 RepID=A0AB34GE45_ESCRO|nr:hypothetical protein J1605_014281 [Eschrichtius robustus]